MHLKSEVMEQWRTFKLLLFHACAEGYTVVTIPHVSPILFCSQIVIAAC